MLLSASGRVYDGVGPFTMITGDPIVHTVSRSHTWSDGNFGHVSRRAFRRPVAAEADEALQSIAYWECELELCRGNP
jgi:hypothetical protein